MDKVDVYLVRHGETGGNVAHRHQREDSALTQLGKQQAAEAAKQVAALKPTYLFVSTRVRAVETGQAIAAATDLIPETDPLFVELKRPDHVYGHFHRSVKSISYLLAWWFGRIDGDGEDGAGESYIALLNRISLAKRKLSCLPAGSRVVVVSHTVFINMFLAHMNNQKPMSFLRAFVTFLKVRRLGNGSITHLVYNKDEDSWQRVD